MVGVFSWCRSESGAVSLLADDIGNIDSQCSANGMNTDHRRYPEYRTALRATKERRRIRPDYSVNYTHELADEATESSGRFVVRAVPLLYGMLVGVLMGNLIAGLLVGALVALVADFKMGSHSLLRLLFGSLMQRGCPVVAVTARGVAILLGYCGIDLPRRLREMRCGAA